LDISGIHPRIYPKYIWNIFSNLTGIPRLSGKKWSRTPKPALTYPSPKRPYGCFRAGPPAVRVACCRLLSLWTPQAVHLCSKLLYITENKRTLLRSTVIQTLLISGLIQTNKIQFTVNLCGRSFLVQPGGGSGDRHPQLVE
jgi:hypothetical protein